ncbi:diaminopimelate epimerase [Magnetococcales bacterium HHB-1]
MNIEEIPFIKMHGLGNDFVILDQLDQTYPLSKQEITTLTDRRFGVGCDQLIVLLPSKKAHTRMVIYNSDGSQAEMCGNAARCVALYLKKDRQYQEEPLYLETLAGRITLYSDHIDDDKITVDMGKPDIVEKRLSELERQIPAHSHAPAEAIEVSMGNPHAIFFRNQVEMLPLEQFGPVISKDKRFPNQTNVEIAQIIDKNHIRMRVWERGAGITKACGTGACATAVAAAKQGLTERKLSVELDGGVLDIHWQKDGHVLMTGPAKKVFRGIYLLKKES